MKIVLITLALLIVGFTTATTTVNAKQTPYEVGFNDGCTDAPIVGIAPANQLAANQHTNAGHHSAQYLDGYSAGIINCGNSSGGYYSAVPNSSGGGGGHQNGYNQNEYNNNNSNNRYQAQSQTATPHYSCFTLIGSCRGGETYQGQSLNN